MKRSLFLCSVLLAISLNVSTSWAITEVYIWDPDPTPLTGPAWASTCEEWQVNHQYSTGDLPTNEDLRQYRAIFVSLGVFPYNHVLSFTESTRLAQYLMEGGCIFLEGGDIWFYDPQWASLRDLFGIGAMNDGDSEAIIDRVLGIENTFTAGMTFSYEGENQYIDQLYPRNEGFTILENEEPRFTVGIAKISSDYYFRTVGLSVELGGFQNTSEEETPMRALMGEILEFFQVRDFLPAPQSLRARLTIKNGPIYEIDLEWTQPATTDTLVEYHIYLSENGAEPYLLDRVDAGQTEYTHRVMEIMDREYTVVARYTLGESEPSNPVLITEYVNVEPTVASINIPPHVHLAQNFPNPFNPNTTISFDLPVASPVTLSIYTIKGEHLTDLVHQRLAPGTYTLDWQGTDQFGQAVPSGTYMYILTTPQGQWSRQMVLLR
ncbi:MAG: T9SS C-terminal target domain-containing protein [Gemmatimonadetes bacterium]|nr:MAG: T9SS C-terminal target domain-containing protein [Gemmatimonadota bacterium]